MATQTAKKARRGRDAKGVIERINDYYSREPDFFSKLIGTIDRPLDWMAATLPPDSHATTSFQLKKSALVPLAQTAAETFSNLSVFEDFSPPADSVEEVRKRSVQEMWDVSERQYDFNAVMTGLHGFGTGLGGPAFVAADVPSVMMSNFRLTAQVALSFGYDWSPEQLPLMLQSISLGMDNVTRRVSHRQAIFIYLQQLQEWIEQSATEDSIDDFIKKHLNESGNVFGEWIAKSPDSLGAHLSSKALSHVVPVLGGAANAGINIWMITQTHHAAQAVYAERRLRDEFGDAWVNEQIDTHKGSKAHAIGESGNEDE